MKDDPLKELRELQLAIQEATQKESAEWWDNLSTEKQQLAFYTVMKKIYQYRVVEGHGYRGTLYEAFGWGPEAYRIGMECNFFDLHNMIYDAQELSAMKGVNRFEVIDEEGRTYVNHLNDDQRVKFSLQDDDRTLKVFISSDT